MKRIVFGLLLLLMLTGCKTNNNVDVSASSSTESQESSSSSSSSEEESVSFKVFSPRYSLDDNEMTISGTAITGSEIKVYKGESELASSQSTDGKFNITMPISTVDGDETSYTIENGTEKEEIPIKTKSYLQSISKDKASNNSSESITSSSESSTASSEKVESNLDLLDYQEEGIENASSYPAETGVMLYDKTESNFKGMNYYFEGQIIGKIKLENVSDGNAWLVKNENGYVMPVEYYYFSAKEGDTVKVWGTLSGLGYSSKDLGVDNIVGVAGSMHALSVEINGNMEY